MLQKHWERQSTKLDVTLEKITEARALSNYVIIDQEGPGRFKLCISLQRFIFWAFLFQVTAKFCNVHSIKPPNFGLRTVTFRWQEWWGFVVWVIVFKWFDILETRSACHISRTNNVHGFQFKEGVALIKYSDFDLLVLCTWLLLFYFFLRSFHSLQSFSGSFFLYPCFNLLLYIFYS